jgi:hypothetical protein
MAAIIVVVCPTCDKHLNVPAEVQGKRIRCKNCQSVFTAKPAAGAKAAKPAPSAKSTPKSSPRTKPNAPAAPAVKPPGAFEQVDATPYTFLSEDASPHPAPVPKAEAPKPAAKKKLLDEDQNPYGLTQMELASRCPHCAKELEEDAVICLHCGYNTQTRARAQTVRTYTNTATDQFMWLLPGILCCVAILALIGFDAWFWFGLQSVWDDWDSGMSKSFSMGVRVWVLVMTLFACWLLGKFAFKRLVLNAIRPEQEKH